MPHGTRNDHSAQQPDSSETHRSWCDIEEHARIAEDGLAGCVSRQFTAGRFGGWLTEDESGSPLIFVDWGRPRTGEFTPWEAAELIEFLAVALGKAQVR